MNTKLIRGFLVCVAIAMAALWLMPSGPFAWTTHYGHALFGNGASAEDVTRLDFIVQGNDIYVDENNDQLAQANELIARNSTYDIKASDGNTRYRLTGVSLKTAPENVTDKLPQQLVVKVDVLSPENPNKVLFKQTGAVTVAEQPNQSAWAHFNGPLTFSFLDEWLSLPARGKPTVDLRVLLATQSYSQERESEEEPKLQTVAFSKPSGDTTEGECCTPAITCNDCKSAGSSNMTQVAPGTLIPIASIEFPSSEEGETITQEYPLDQFC